MGIFNSFDSIIDLFSNGSMQDLESISNKAGVNKTQTGGIIAMALPMILEAMTNNNQDPSGLESFSKAVSDHAQRPDYSSITEYVQNADEQDGEKMLNHIFDDKNSIIDRIAQTMGVEPAAVKRVLILIAPLVLKYIAGEAKKKDLGTDGVQKETEVIRDQVNDKIGKYTQNGQNSPIGDNMFDEIIGGFLKNSNGTANENNSTQVNQNEGSLFDSLKNIFK